MARLRLLDEEQGRAAKGMLGPEARRVLVHRPEMADAIGLYNEAVHHSRLDPVLHEYVRYRLAEINDCPR